MSAPEQEQTRDGNRCYAGETRTVAHHETDTQAVRYGAQVKTAPALRQQRDPGPNPAKEGLMNESIPRQTVREEQARDALFPATETPAIDHHWFVDVGGYCAACNLPRANSRHVERAGA